MHRTAASRGVRTVSVAASVLWHLALVFALALVAARPLMLPNASAVDVTLVPPFVVPLTSPKLGREAGTTLKKPPNEEVGSTGPAPIAPSATPAPPLNAGTPAPTGTQPTTGDSVRAVLRASLGCADPKLYNLSDDEKRRCDERAVAQARKAPDMPLAHLDPAVQAYYDAVLKSYEPPNTPGRIELGRITCKAGDKPTGTKQLGSLGCYFKPPPLGPVTAEFGIEPP